jgi:hypothetical protein
LDLHEAAVVRLVANMTQIADARAGICVDKRKLRKFADTTIEPMRSSTPNARAGAVAAAASVKRTGHEGLTACGKHISHAL